jgi:hypothetical protein
MTPKHSDSMPTRINLLSSPRNISTALMYSFAQRQDCRVIDEPLYAAYLKESGAAHPGRDEILQSQSQNAVEVIDQILSINSGGELFIKNMAHHMEGLDWAHLSQFQNIIFIRQPRQIIASYAQVIENPQMRDVGIEMQVRLFNYMKEAQIPVIILDSGELLKNPTKVLQHLCEKIGIPFQKEMLSWRPGPRQEDGIWAKYWYSNVHQSTRFENQATSSRSLPNQLEPLAKEAEKMYHYLSQYSIKS